MICEGWEGSTVDGKFPLLEWLGGWADRCVFLTIRQGTQKANIKLVLAAGEDAEAQLSNWEAAKALSHPFLVQLMEAGRYTIQESEVVYLLTEKTDAFLSGIIPRKALSPVETKAILGPILDALSFLHGKGLAHGNVKPSNIVQVGDQWKLASDEMAGTSEFAKVGRKLDGYDAPEVAEGKLTPAADIWALGIIAVEAFAQRTPVWDRDARANLGVPAGVMPELFREMARGCLRWEPADRISIDEAKDLLARYTPREGGEPIAEKGEPTSAAPEPDVPAIHDRELRPRISDSFRQPEPEPAEFAPRSRMFSNLEEDDEHTGRKGSFLVAILVLLAVLAVLAVRFRGRLFSLGETHNGPTQSQSAPPNPQPPQSDAGSGQAGSANANPPAPGGAQTQPQVPAPEGSAQSQGVPPSQSSPENQNAPATQPESQPAQTQAPPAAPEPKQPASSGEAESKPVPRKSAGASELTEANSKGAVVKRVMPNVERGASGSMRRPMDVELRVSVDEEGRVADVEYMTLGPGNYFARKAHQAAEAWRFKPPRSAGRPVASRWVLLFRFERYRTDVTATEVR